MSGVDDTLKVAPRKATAVGWRPGSTGAPKKAAAVPKGRRSEGFVILAVLLCWVAIGIAAASLWPIYQTGRYAVLVGVAVLVGTLIAGLGARFRWPSWVLVSTGFFAAALMAVWIMELIR